MDARANSFEGFRKSLFPAITSGRTDNSMLLKRSDGRDILSAQIHDDALSTFHLDAVFEEIDNIIRTNSQKVTAHSYSATSVMTYINDGYSRPKVYQASTATCTAPGGIRQTQKTSRDSHSGIERISVGHHLGDRARVIERSRNRKTGQHDEQTEYINMDEGDCPAFQEEWRRRTTSLIANPPTESYPKQPLHEDSGNQTLRSVNPYKWLPLTNESLQHATSSTARCAKPTNT